MWCCGGLLGDGISSSSSSSSLSHYFLCLLSLHVLQVFSFSCHFRLNFFIFFLCVQDPHHDASSPTRYRAAPSTHPQHHRQYEASQGSSRSLPLRLSLLICLVFFSCFFLSCVFFMISCETCVFFVNIFLI